MAKRKLFKIARAFKRGAKAGKVARGAVKGKKGYKVKVAAGVATAGAVGAGAAASWGHGFFKGREFALGLQGHKRTQKQINEIMGRLPTNPKPKRRRKRR